MDFYEELKAKNDIHIVASILGYNGKRTGSAYQGDCPKHSSTDHRCLVLWSGFQGFKCFHCEETGDVIKLVELFKKVDHRQAVKFLADRVGMPVWGGKELTPEEIAQKEVEVQEKVLVESMLTEAAEWYYSQLKNFPDIMNHLTGHYGFSLEIIERLRIGFGPPRTSHPNITSDLANHLSKFPEFQGKLALSGLFNFKTPSGPFWDYFQGRIIFPYWKGGKVVYMAGRATPHTPIYQGKEPAKYTKLRTHKSDDEKGKFISRFIQNDSFMGEDEIREEKEIVIAEGAPDWVSAIDKGFAAVSPVTTNFREQDNEKLVHLTAGAESIFIVNDNEENQAGFKGALNTGKKLTKAGKNVFIVELPRPQGKDKIDLNEYFLNHTAEDLRQIMNSSKSLLEILIDKLPADFIKAQPMIKEEIAPLLIELDEAKYEHFFEIIRKKVNTNRKALDAEIEAARLAKEEVDSKEENKIDPEIEKGAQDIAHDPLLFKKRIDAVNQAGVVGERKNIAMYFCALDSRLLPENLASPNVLALKNAGHYGAGKSYTLQMCLQIYPKTAYHHMTNGSAKSLYFLKEGLKHKCLIVTEGYQYQTKNAQDSELVYSTRTLLSEGRVSYWVTEKNEDGKYITVERKLEGPTSFVTTTTMEALEPQMEDRLFTIHPDESSEQTQKIIIHKGNEVAGLFLGVEPKTVESWKHYHSSLKPVEVVIPFGPQIAEFITRNGRPPIHTRRAFNRVLIVIRSITCAYQHQRQKDDQGRISSEMSDYWMALRIVQDAFRENLGALDEKTGKYMEVIKENGRITPGNLAKKRGVKNVSGWTTKNVAAGRIQWCREDGSLFKDEDELDKAKRSGMAFLKIAENYTHETITGLPTPFDLTGDPRWDEGGELLKLYDLELEKQTAVCSVLGVNEVLNGVLNTPEEKEFVENIQESSIENDGVKVLSENTGGEGNIFGEYTWEGQADEINSEEGSADNDSGRPASPVAEILKFDDPEPKSEPKKRKSQLEQLGIPKLEREELTEEEQKRVDELASEFSRFLTPKKSEDFCSGLDFGNAF
jgi:DNA primase catalytic core